MLVHKHLKPVSACCVFHTLLCCLRAHLSIPHWTWKCLDFSLFFSGLEVFNIQLLCQKMLQRETQPKEICTTILITCAPFWQLHPWLISFSPLNLFSMTFLSPNWAKCGEKFSAVLIVLGSDVRRTQSHVWIDVIVIHFYFSVFSPVSLTLAVSVALFFDIPSTVSQMCDLLWGRLGIIHPKLTTEYMYCHGCCLFWL